MIPKPSTDLFELENRIKNLETIKSTNHSLLIESGTVDEDNNLWKETKGKGCRRYIAEIIFQKIFSEKPEILLSITGIITNDVSYWMFPEDLSEKGFTIVLESEEEKLTYKSVNWLAYLQK